MHHTLPIALFMLGLLAGVPVSALVIGIPAFLEKQWRLDAAQLLGQESVTENQPRLSLSLLPNQIDVRFTMTLLVMGLLSSWAGLHFLGGANRPGSPCVGRWFAHPELD